MDMYDAVRSYVDLLEDEENNAVTPENARRFDQMSRFVADIVDMLRTSAREQGHQDLFHFTSNNNEAANRNRPANRSNEESRTVGERPGSSTNSNRRNRNNRQARTITVRFTEEELGYVLDSIDNIINRLTFANNNNGRGNEELNRVEDDRNQLTLLYQMIQNAGPMRVGGPHIVYANNSNTNNNNNRRNNRRNNAPRPRNEASRASNIAGQSSTNTRRRRGRKNRKTRRT